MKEQFEKVEKEDQGELERKEAMRVLTGEQYFQEQDNIEKSLLQFREFFYGFQQESKETAGWKDQLVEATKRGEIEVSFEKFTPTDIVRKIEETKNSEIKVRDEERIRITVEHINDFCKKYNLDFQASLEMTPDKIISELEKAYYARLYMLQNRIEENPEFPWVKSQK